MKKLISLVLALALVLAFAATATADAVLTLDRIQTIVGETDWRVFTIDEENKNLWLELSEEGAEYAVVMGVYVEGNTDNILNCYLLMDEHYALAESELDKAAVACNTWNNERRWPNAYLDTENRYFRGEGNLPCVDGVSDAMLLEYLDRHLSGMKQYLAYLGDNGFDKFAHFE